MQYHPKVLSHINSEPLPDQFQKQEHPSVKNPNLKPVRTQITDSRDAGVFELRIGYKFSVVAMELCVKSMQIGERSRFLCMPEYCEVQILYK